jgi:ribonuclease HI
VIRIWTDGCCLKNPGGAGGWAFVVEDKGSGRVLHEASGGHPKTTNNRMELIAAIKGLRWAIEHWPEEKIEVWSDSKYVVEGMNAWRHSWKGFGWRKKALSPDKVANAKLWVQLDEADLLLDGCRFVWVKGHNGTPLNEQADRLADAAARADGVPA